MKLSAFVMVALAVFAIGCIEVSIAPPPEMTKPIIIEKPVQVQPEHSQSQPQVQVIQTFRCPTGDLVTKIADCPKPPVAEVEEEKETVPAAAELYKIPAKVQLKYNSQWPSYTRAEIYIVAELRERDKLLLDVEATTLPELSGENKNVTSHVPGINHDFYELWLVNRASPLAPKLSLLRFNAKTAVKFDYSAYIERSVLDKMLQESGTSLDNYDSLELTAEANDGDDKQNGVLIFVQTGSQPLTRATQRKLDYVSSYPNFASAGARAELKEVDVEVELSFFTEGLPKLAGKKDQIKTEQEGFDFSYYALWLKDSKGELPTKLLLTFSGGKPEPYVEKIKLTEFVAYGELVLTGESNDGNEEPSKIALLLGKYVIE